MNRRMFTRSAIVLALALTTAAALLSTPAVTRADSPPFLTANLSNPGKCKNTGFAIDVVFTWDFTGVPLPATYDEDTTINGALVYSSSNAKISNSGSPAYSLFSVYGNTAQPYTIQDVFTYKDATGAPFIIQTFSGTCASGHFTMSVSYEYPTSTGSSDGFKGPYYPSDFVQREITCNTPLLSSAGGEPAGSASLLAGQHWYVNPVPVVVNGKSYTEVSVVNRRLFIPTSCVG